MILWGDLETYCDVPLKDGTYRYAENAEVMLFAYAIDDEPAEVWDRANGEPIPRKLYRAHDNADEIVFHNAMFDRTVLNNADLFTANARIDVYRCTMAQALAHSMPGSLEKLCAIFKIGEDQAKMKDSKQLIQLFCKPMPKNSKLRRATSQTHPDEWARFKEYARLDVEAMRAVRKKLPDWNYRGRELALWHLDQEINDRGVYVDQALAHAATRGMARAQKLLAERTMELTNEVVESSTKRAKLLKYILEEYGVDLPDMKASTLERRLEDPDLPWQVKALIATRLESALTSGKKYKALLNGITQDGRLHGLLQFCGALRTGRWAGRLFQPQNLMRIPRWLKPQYDFAIECILNDCEDLVFDGYPYQDANKTPKYASAMEVIAATVRGAIIAPPGKKLCVADLSNIEGRGLAWLARAQWKLDAFAAADADPDNPALDLYNIGYSRGFGVPLDAVVADGAAGGTLRLYGKVQELACGYQGGKGAYLSMAAVYGIKLEEIDGEGLTEKDIQANVKAYRAGNPEIVAFWYDLDSAARQAVMYRGELFEVGCLRLKCDGAWLRIQLPSGRYLCYPSPKLATNARGKLALSYMGVHQYTRKWQRISTYGGKLAENVTQALARDVMAWNMPAINAAGYAIVLSVHDEIPTETPDSPAFSGRDLAARLSAVPPWAPGLPLAARGYETHRYRKD